MAIEFQIPADVNAIDYFASFAGAFSDAPHMAASLLGVQDSLRQAALIPREPLGLLACLTAEEEAAAFLYYSLRSKGYPLPEYGKIQRHGDKAKVLIFAAAMEAYFFSSFFRKAVLRISDDDGRPTVTLRFGLGKYEVVVEDALSIISTKGDDANSHETAVSEAVDRILSEIVPTGASLKSQIQSIQNRRNRCIYGSPADKDRMVDDSDMDHFVSNCAVMIVLGFLVMQGEGRTESMNKLVDRMYSETLARLARS